MTTGIVAKSEQNEDVVLDVSLRPRTLAEYVGQEQVKKNLMVFIAASKKRHQPLEHVLIHGGPGLGKTTLATVIAREVGVPIRTTSGPALERTGDLAAILTSLENGEILFIDEIHRLSRTVEEMLYPAMEDFVMDLVIGKGPGAQTIRLDLPKFTLIGATTRVGAISSPLRDRFGTSFHLDFYTEEEIARIIHRSAGILSVSIDEGAIATIAARSRKTPRVANRLLKRARDYAEVHGKGRVTGTLATEALTMLEVDALGLDRRDRQILSTIIEKFNGGPVGAETLATALSEEIQTLEDVYEPYLIQIGFLDRTARGRVATPAAYEHLGLPGQKKLL
jgi:Holliday junction DNA helicase RuvB